MVIKCLFYSRIPKELPVSCFYCLHMFFVHLFKYVLFSFFTLHNVRKFAIGQTLAQLYMFNSD